MARPITDIRLTQAFDSRGNPTVRAFVKVNDIWASAMAPAGASSGSHEAPFLRDGSGDYEGLAVTGLIAHYEPDIRSTLIGVDADDIEGVEIAMTTLDGSPNWSRIGGNTAMAVTVAAWLAASRSHGVPPWKLLVSWFETSPCLPLPMVNIVSGGAHAGNAIDIQDVLVIPTRAGTPSEAIHTAWSVRSHTRRVLEQAGHATALVADEGGLAARFSSSTEAIAAVREGITLADVEADIALDVAATEFEISPGRYLIDGSEMDSRQLVQLISTWVEDLGVVSIEDPLGEDDDWSAVTELVQRAQIIGDDRYVTNVDRLAKGISAGEANTILIKPNQAGSLLRAVRALLMAKRDGWSTVVSARSGETEESWLVDLAVGLGAGQLKVGSTMRSERTAKWNRLLEIAAFDNLPFTQWKSIRER